MTYMYKPAGRDSCDKLTFSIWFYVSSDALDAQAEWASTPQAEGGPDKHPGGGVQHRRIPIMEFGSSIEPRVGVHIGMELIWEGFLGACWWNGYLDAPDPFFGSPAVLWMSGIGLEKGNYGADTPTSVVRDQWAPFGIGSTVTTGGNYDYGDAWKANPGLIVLFNGTAVGNGASFFYHYPEALSIELQPCVRYNGFSDHGINDWNVTNCAAGDFPYAPSSWTLQGPNSWYYHGVQTCLDDNPRCNLRKGDKTVGTKLVNAQVFFTNFWPSPKNGHVLATPTIGGNDIRADEYSGKYFAFGDLIAYFPPRPGVNYGTPAQPSVLYIENDKVVFEMTGKWPGKCWYTDGAIVPTLKFDADGSFKPDSWNHVFFTCDLTTMRLTGGNQDRTRDTDIPPPDVGGSNAFETNIYPPSMTTPPKCAMVLNGVKKEGFYDPGGVIAGPPGEDSIIIPPSFWPTGLFCTFMDNKEAFKMQLKGAALNQPSNSISTGAPSGQVGFPVIPQEVGRWGATGKNQEVSYAYTHIYFDKYIEPTSRNLQCFYWRSKNSKYNFVVPPPDKTAAIKKFGKPEVWCYRDENNNIRFENNQGTGGKFKIVGEPTSPPEYPGPSAIRDFQPGPGQTDHTKPLPTTEGV